MKEHLVLLSWMIVMAAVKVKVVVTIIVQKR